MKKSDFASFLVYILMFALAILVGFLSIRPTIESWSINNSILIIVIAAVVAILFNSLLLEAFHVLGGLAGKMKISFFSVFGLSLKRDEKDKFHFCFSSFDGLTGETRFVPKDIKKSSVSASIVFPLLGFLLEVVGCVIAMGVATREHQINSSSGIGWLYVSAIIMMTVGGMVFLYDYFPAQLDSVTDGYKMTILNKPINREAYNQMLLAARRAELNQPAIDVPLYDDVTDFTYWLNNQAVYQAIRKEDYRGAIKIVQKAFDTPERLSQAVKDHAMTTKLSLVLLTTRREDGAKYYESISNEQRKYIATLSDAVSLRCYILISGVIEGAVNETNYALDKIEKITKRVPKEYKDIEENLINLSVTRVHLLHPDWQLNYAIKENSPKTEEKK